MLDTNIVSDLVRNPQGPVAGRVREVGGERLRTSAIVAAELRYGAEKAGRGRLFKQIETVLGAIEIAPFDASAAIAYGALRARLERMGRTIGGNDMLIAAHAIALGDTIVTANEREFARIEGLPEKIGFASFINPAATAGGREFVRVEPPPLRLLHGAPPAHCSITFHAEQLASRRGRRWRGRCGP